MPADIKRRKAVMARSIKLGHCVCNPKLPCPCPTFKEQNICTCAGERPPVKSGNIPLTKHVRKAGCASKIGQADLSKILAKLPPISDPRVLVGTAAGDDAGIYRLDDRLSLVQTVDVFTPCVDDPYLFGQISAANSVSDVYAMGGRPLTALSIIGFPIDELDGTIMETVLRGGIEKLNEADCPLVGGHSINDEEIKCGFAVTGLIDSNKVVERGKARPGDLLVLTKPIGTGMVAFAAQIGKVSRECLDEVGAFMAELNRDAAELMVKYGAHACTDVTGFGLAGHLVEMVRTSGVNAEIDMSDLPVFHAVEACLENDILPGAIERNQEYSMAWVQSDGVADKNLTVLYDPQTSGGLLITLPEVTADSYVKEMRDRGHESTSVIGRIVERKSDREEGKVIVTNSNLRNLIGKGEVIEVTPKKKANPSTVVDEKKSEKISMADTACCANPPRLEEDSHVDAMPAFMDFMSKAGAEGAVDSRSKKLIWLALSVGFRCKPCLKTHLKSALEMGITREEVEEAANLGIAFGGCSAMLLYREVCQALKV